ncbi:thiolase C-terminal domain-containing protein [Sphingosinicella microcystinivorans]|uniref:Acetyl-CoA acetyltransferase n=1 Tax=Sphingosinicella microcystinivorans TaxID=335406 RepID=A0AAD1FZZ6_SPHMI|nr:beta-ketoacyl synthase N-terminal-like domain-containing protein [Sphingosinicella microcystinivorans]RKS85442.1 acetyl-CoA acetyltransferase [Sphingosinicella microcystinivorans]BBE33268.1 putative lipid-transfer protein Ltp1/thiolase [Sphingosinicella microcystinivorans]
MAKVCVAGIGMTRFTKVSAPVPYERSGAEAARAALADAGLAMTDIDLAVASYAMGETCSGQVALYALGLHGVPIVNVSNACASGSTALYLARQAILSGEADAVLAVGFEQMGRQFIRGFPDRTLPVGWIDDRTRELVGVDADVSTVGWFAGAGREYLDKTGYDTRIFAEVAAKARRHAHHNPNAAFRDLLTVEEILESKLIVDPLTKFECSAPTNGGAAVILTSMDFAKRRGLRTDVRLSAQKMRTDSPSAQDEKSMIKVVGFDMVKQCVADLYEATGVGPEDLDIVELHDCFASNEVISYEALGLVPEGEGGRMALDGDNSYGGRYVVNPSGGLIGKGHPIGATGVAQCVELTTQLRGEAGPRQVEVARLALQHNIGLGGACVVGLYERA